MDASPPPWQPLALLAEQFQKNLSVLRARDAALADRLAAAIPASRFFIAALPDQIVLGRLAADGQIERLPNPVPPASASQIAQRLFPSGHCSEPVLVAGIDQGWLWDRLYRLPTAHPLPGHTPPLYLLAGDITKLWAALHFQDWSQLLADGRAMIFTGEDAAAQYCQALQADETLPLPRLSLTVEPTLWRDGRSGDAIFREVAAARDSHLAKLLPRITAAFPTASHHELADRLHRGGLRVLGLTSRYTTFLQYSMRDWLAAFEQLGHTTHLVIEPAGHAMMSNLVYLEAINAFRPDVIVLIDHFRDEFRGMPRGIPCINWVQDRLPHLFSPAAGPRQGDLDYTLGYGRMECIVEHGYPAGRFMPAPVGVNESRFTPTPLSNTETGRFACDVAFVTHASVPAEQLIQAEIVRGGNDPAMRRFLTLAVERLTAIYDAGEFLTETLPLRLLVDTAARDAGVTPNDPAAVHDFFLQKVNNALFRHQTIRWAAEAGVDLRLYGKGWKQHPEFARFACGVADNERELAAIYRASKINLQATPFGAAHQRLFDGLAAGGFFLLRACTGDRCERIYRGLWHYFERADVRDGQGMLRLAANMPAVGKLLNEAEQLTGEQAATIADRYYRGIAEAADGGFTRCGSTLWPQFDDVAFATRQQLHSLLHKFLGDAHARASITNAMRARVLERLTYRGITQRLLDFVAADLAGRPEAATKAA